MKTELEAIIDKHSLYETLSTIHEICLEKADHINENWQDNKLADKWRHAGNQIMNLADRIIKIFNR